MGFPWNDGRRFARLAAAAAALWALAPNASGQAPPTTADLHGAVPAVRADPRDPVAVWAPPPLARGWSAGFTTEVGVGPALYLIERTRGADPTLEPFVQRLVGANLNAVVRPVPRLGVALTLPVFPYVTADLDANGDVERMAAVGAVRAAVPVAILGDELGNGFSLAAVPWASFSPGIGTAAMSGTAGSGGLIVATGVRSDEFSLVASGGPSVGRWGTMLGVPIRTSLTGAAGAAVGARIQGPVWAQVEARMNGNLQRIPPDRIPPVVQGNPGIPSGEALLTLAGAFGRTELAASGGTRVLPGVGGALFRGFVAVGVHGELQTGADSAPEPFRFVVTDPTGKPVVDAQVAVAGVAIGTTDVAGALGVQTRVAWSKGVTVSHPRFEPATVGRPTGDNPATVTLNWIPATLDLRITDVEGRPVPVIAKAISLDNPDAPPVEGAADAMALAPGRYRLELAFPDGSGSQVREVIVPVGGGPPVPIEAVAHPSEDGDAVMVLRIAEPDGTPIVGAIILIDGVPVGTTADGGFVEVRGLRDGVRDVEVQHAAFTARAMPLQLTPDAEEIGFVLRRTPGTVRVRVRGPDNEAVTDATVRFVGSSRLPPMSVDDRGERTHTLSRGAWVVAVSSPSFGVQERDILVDDGNFELLTVDVVLRPLETGSAELELRVVDPAGQPVADATIVLDGAPLGSTSTGGTVRLQGLLIGPRTLEVTAVGLLPTEPKQIVLRPGLQDRLEVVRWEAGSIDLFVRGPDGPVTDAVVRFVSAGPSEAPIPIGNTGRLLHKLKPGKWTLVVSSGQLGVQERDIVVPEAPGSRLRVEVVLVPVEGGVADLTVRVVAPDGALVDGAEIYLDGALLGRTSTGGTVRVSKLDVGPRMLLVRRTPFQDYTDTVRLLEGPQTYEAAVDWSSAIRVRVKHQGQPVQNATVRLLGERMLPISPVDAYGEHTAEVEPGLWLVLVSSPTHGVAEQDVEVKPGRLAIADIVMRPPAADRTDIVVTVVDPDGRAAEHATVWVDNARLEQTEQGGTVLVRGVMPGPVVVTVEAPDMVKSDPIDVVLEPGGERLTVRLKWVEVPVLVRTRTPEGVPVDATVQWTGPSDRPALQSGKKGEAKVILHPGTWRVFARAGATDGSDTLEVEIGDEPRPIDLVLRPTGASMVGSQVAIADTVHFDFGLATLRPDADPVLAEVARVLLADPSLIEVEIQGHTDNIGTVEVNHALSQARAQSVVAALVARGVPRETLVPRGYGPLRPMAPNETEEGRTTNRRVQFVIVERVAVREPTVAGGR